MKDNDTQSKGSRLLHSIAPLLGVAIFAAALWALHDALHDYHYHDIRAALDAIPLRNVALALALAFLSYTLLSIYDALALWYVGRGLHYGRIAFTSFIGYALSNNVGYSVLSGGSVRYRLYTAWGLNTVEITKVIGFCTVTSVLGFSTLGGTMCLYDPYAIARSPWFPFGSARPLGVVLLAIPVAYLAAVFVFRKPVTIRQWTFDLPAPRIALCQMAAGITDYAVAAGILYALMPPELKLSFPAFAGVFVLAMTAGILSQVPGALGVFEAIIIFLLSPDIPASEALGALLGFRVIYYLLPLVIGMVLLAGYEVHQRRAILQRLTDAVARTVSPIVPQLFAFSTFVGGAILLFSGVTPAVHGRLHVLRDIVPLPMIELSHFLASLVGLGLILLSRALLRRIDAAYWLTVISLGAGACFSLFKGLDYEEAGTLFAMLVVFLPCRGHFYRKASLFAPRLNGAWVAAVLLVVASSVWLGLFTYKHVEYSQDLWWRFSLGGDASRFLRASVGVVVLLGVVGLTELLRPAPTTPQLPGPAELEEAAAIVRESPETPANLALLGDKALLYNDPRTAFIMYAVEKRSWIAMGDPVGPRTESPDLVWRFRELADLHGAWTVFYHVHPDQLFLYLDVGLTLIKMGEEARVDLATFSLDGADRKAQRYVLRKLDKDGYTFRVAPPEEVPALLPRLKVVSDAWLAEKHTREKRFSLGNFDPEYLKRYAHGLVEQNGQIIAFANLWESGGKNEISVDLMRYGKNAPNGVMDFLFTHLMLYGQEQGYAWFNLGMAPLAGLENQPNAPMWHRIGSLIYRHGEHFYNYQGLRHYKDKFGPEWQPRYLACPGGLALPQVLTNLVTLISGGVSGAVAR